MSSPLAALIVAVDPLLRKAVTEQMALVCHGDRVEAVSPTRVTPERIASAELIVLAAFEPDIGALEAVTAVIAAAARPTLLVAAGLADSGRAVAARLNIPAPQVIGIPHLNIRDELARAASKLEAAYKLARTQTWRPPERVPESRSTEAPVAPRRPPEPSKTSGAPYLGPVICIGASTGGTEALLSVLSGMARYCPPIAIVQHMPEAYVGSFAERLDQSCAIDVALAGDNVALRPGLALLGPGGRQFRLRKDAGGIWTKLGETERIGGHCPAVDVLMKSAAAELGKRTIGVILTGMGRDGSDGLLAMRRAGARTVAQDEATSVVYGMPKAAFEDGAADTVLPLGKIAGWISGQTMTLMK